MTAGQVRERAERSVGNARRGGGVQKGSAVGKVSLLGLHWAVALRPDRHGRGGREGFLFVSVFSYT